MNAVCPRELGLRASRGLGRPGLLIAIGFLALGSLRAGEGAKAGSAKDAKVTEAEAEAAFDTILEKFEKERNLQAYERMPTISSFGTAPSKKAVEFLEKLYGTEENPGIRVAITQALGQMGSADSVRVIVTKGLPLLLDEIGLDEVRKALSGPLSAEAEDWLVKNALSSAPRSNPRVFDVLLKVLAGLKTPTRIPVLLAEVKKGTPQLQAAILNALRSIADPKLGEVAMPLIKSVDADVQLAAYEVLGTLALAKHKPTFVTGLKSARWEIRSACVEALAKSKDKDVARLLSGLLKDKEKRVQVVVVRALLQRGGTEVIEPLFKAIDGSDDRVKDDIADALARLTGKNFGPVSAQWESWWTQEKAKPREYAAMSNDEFAKLKEEDKNEAKTVYFGLRVMSNHMAFLIDSSESMDEEYTPKGKTATGDASKSTTVVVESKPKVKSKSKAKTKKKRGPTRMDLAKKELTEVVKNLKNGQNLNILRFNSLITDFAALTFAADTKVLVKLSAEVRPKIAGFIAASKAEGLTNLLGVLKEAMEYPGLDTIYLLSDGAPTIGVTDHAELLKEVARLNHHLKVKIHTISFDPKPAERALLRALSEQNFGVYVER